MPPVLQPGATEGAALVDRSVKSAVLRGAAQLCPACGQGRLYRAFLKVNDTCPVCAEALHHQRADDAPAYFTMVIVAHIVVGGLLSVEQAFSPPSWLQLSIWLPLTVILSLILLPRIKGILIAVQWALRMHGFGGAPDVAIPEPMPNKAQTAPGPDGTHA